MISTGSYKAKQFNLSGLNGISDETLEMHSNIGDGNHLICLVDLPTSTYPFG